MNHPETSRFAVHRNPAARSTEERAAILAAPGFGKHFTDHMVSVDYVDGAWTSPRVEPYGPIALDPASLVLHYAQTIFEGLKAYRQPDGTISTFRPEANARRFHRSAERLAMPPLPEEMFLDSLRELVAVDGDWVPAAGGEDSLYFRPFMFATEVGLGVRPADEYRYLLIASPAGAYFSRGVAPVTVFLCEEFVRASPGGTGSAKFGGNYAASLLAQEQATQQGCDQVVWLDAYERTYVEEMGGMNLFFVLGEGPDAEIVTPELSGSLLPGVTRDSLLTLARERGHRVSERRISVSEWREGAADGRITEVFACGTAAVITPVGEVRSTEDAFVMGDGTPGAITMELRGALTDIQRGTAPDPFGWMQTIG